jgi:hypothetical protein
MKAAFVALGFEVTRQPDDPNLLPAFARLTIGAKSAN